MTNATTSPAAATAAPVIADKAALATVILHVDSGPLVAAVNSLKHALERTPEVVKSFLGGLDTLLQLVSMDQGDSFAVRTGEVWIVLQPSDALRDFLAASTTGDLDGHAVQV